ncbi:Surfeit locus protein 2 [Chlorella vulgaris]
MSLPADVQQLVNLHAPHFSTTPEGKIKCELNGHTFPPRADALNTFLKGKKYAKLVKQAEVEAGLSKYEPFIVRSKNLPNMLFCALTGELLNARLAEVKQHMKGKKFNRAKDRFQEDRQELLEEPGLVGSDMEEDEAEDGDGPGVWVPEEVLREYEMGEAEEGQEEEEDDEEEGSAAAAAATATEEAGVPGGKDPGQAAAGMEAGDAAQGKAVSNGKGKSNLDAQQQKKAAGAPRGKQQRKQQQKAGIVAAAAAPAAAANGSRRSKAPKAKRVRTG